MNKKSRCSAISVVFFSLSLILVLFLFGTHKPVSSFGDKIFYYSIRSGNQVAVYVKGNGTGTTPKPYLHFFYKLHGQQNTPTATLSRSSYDSDGNAIYTCDIAQFKNISASDDKLDFRYFGYSDDGNANQYIYFDQCSVKNVADCISLSLSEEDPYVEEDREYLVSVKYEITDPAVEEYIDLDKDFKIVVGDESFDTEKTTDSTFMFKQTEQLKPGSHQVNVKFKDVVGNYIYFPLDEDETLEVIPKIFNFSIENMVDDHAGLGDDICDLYCDGEYTVSFEHDCGTNLTNKLYLYDLTRGRSLNDYALDSGAGMKLIPFNDRNDIFVNHELLFITVMTYNNVDYVFGNGDYLGTDVFDKNSKTLIDRDCLTKVSTPTTVKFHNIDPKTFEFKRSTPWQSHTQGNNNESFDNWAVIVDDKLEVRFGIPFLSSYDVKYKVQDEEVSKSIPSPHNSTFSFSSRITKNEADKIIELDLMVEASCREAEDKRIIDRFDMRSFEDEKQISVYPDLNVSNLSVTVPSKKKLNDTDTVKVQLCKNTNSCYYDSGLTVKSISTENNSTKKVLGATYSDGWLTLPISGFSSILTNGESLTFTVVVEDNAGQTEEIAINTGKEYVSK
ncbi:MAG: hypothetical protein J6U54_03115, partial [Clostridiales bacterium]|nr:hypothetical protein [Clostridiales bacterium]